MTKHTTKVNDWSKLTIGVTLLIIAAFQLFLTMYIGNIHLLAISILVTIALLTIALRIAPDTPTTTQTK